MREENGFLDIRGDDPSEEVSVSNDGPENGRNENKREWSKENFREGRDWLRWTMNLDDFPECHASLDMHGMSGWVDRVIWDRMESITGIDEVIALIVGFGKEEDGEEEVSAGCDCAEPPEPLER